MNNYSILDLVNSQRSNAPLNPQMQQIKNLMHQVQMSANPQLALQQLVNQNPNLQTVLNLAKSNGGNLQQLFYALAQQKGVDPQQILRDLQS